MNSFKKIVSYIMGKLSLLYLKIFGVRIKKNVRITGFPYLVNKGTFIIENNVKINSRYAANPIGGQQFCTFFVSKNAQLLINQGAGISNSTIVCTNQITIGDFVKIGGDCKIYDTDFHALDFNQRINGDDASISKPIIICEGAFVGAGSTILKGVTIGKKSVIGAGSVVAKDIPENEIWAGNPAKFIRKLDS